MSKLKIVISSYDDLKNPYYGGGGVHSIHQVAKRLATEKQVVVFTGKYPGSRDEVIDGVVYKRIGLSFAGPKLGQLIYQLILPFCAISQKYDLWIESFTPPFSTAFLPLFTKRPVIGLAHMLTAKDMQRKYGLPFSIIENLGLKTYQRFIVMTQRAKEKIRLVNKGANIKVIPNGIDLPNRKKRVKKEHILFIGRIEVNQKGLDLLLKAYKKICSGNTPKLLIAGSGTKNEEGKLGRLIKNLNLNEYVEYVGRVSGARKTEVFERAFLVVIPSRFEEFSVVALESASYGLPIVSFDIEGLSWVSREGAMKVKPFNEKALGDEILRLIKNPTLRRKTGTSGREIAKGHSWDSVFTYYRNYIEQTLLIEDRRAYAQN